MKYYCNKNIIIYENMNKYRISNRNPTDDKMYDNIARC